MTECSVLYFDEKYDLGSTRIPDGFIKVSVLGAVRFLAKSNAAILEVPEPLWLRFLPKNLLLIWTWRISGRLKGISRRTVTYAIENNGISSLVFGTNNVRPWVSRLAGSTIGAVASKSFDRIAFGSDGAAAAYDGLPISSKVVTATFEELPAAAAATTGGETNAVVFVGNLEPRKGIGELMTNWPQVERQIADAVLTIVGTGDLHSEVENWCSLSPRSRVFLGKVEHEEVIEVVRENAVLVAPSVRAGRWREQIGLPIVEGLAAGLNIVTTDESGLAAWLKRNGHQVVELPQVSQRLGQALVSALSHRLSVAQIQASLPVQSARIAADHWIHDGAAESVRDVATGTHG